MFKSWANNKVVLDEEDENEKWLTVALCAVCFLVSGAIGSLFYKSDSEDNDD